MPQPCRLCPFALVLLLALPGALPAAPAATLAELDAQQAYKCVRDYLNAAKPEDLEPLRKLVYLDASKLLVEEGTPLWLYQPKERDGLQPAARKTVEDGLRNLLVAALTGPDGVLAPAAADDLKQKAKFQEWHPARALSDLDDNLAARWVHAYLKDTGSPTLDLLKDLIDPSKSVLQFKGGVPTWTYVTKGAQPLTAAQRGKVEQALAAVLRQALGNWREGLLETAAQKELEGLLAKGTVIVSNVGVAGNGPLDPKSPTPVDDIEKKLEQIRTDVAGTRKAVDALGGRVTRVESLDRVVTDLQKTVADLKNRIRPSPAPAHLVIHLPADARLFVDNVFCPLTSDTRAFDTPNLPPSRKYRYTLLAEVVRNGQVVTETRTTDFEAGEEVHVEFPKLAPPPEARAR
jgi:uncharacterized protein (TIGR03000 family)